MLYLHIGTHKTGTSSIQASLFASRADLHRVNVDYFGHSANHSHGFLWRFSSNRMKHGVTINAKLSETDVERLGKEFETALSDFLADTTYKTKVVSGEEISVLSEDDLKKLKLFLDERGIEARVVIYVRNYFDYLSSQMQELVKWGWSIPKLSEGIKKGKIVRPDYRRRIAPSIELFGRDNVDIRIFHPDRFVGGDLLADFCDAIGASSAYQHLTKRRINESLSDTSARIFSDYNEHYPARVNAAYNPERSESAKRYLIGFKGTKFVFADTDVLDAYEANMQADADYMGSLLGHDARDLLVRRPIANATAAETCGKAPYDLALVSFGKAAVDVESVEAANDILLKLCLDKVREGTTLEFIRNKMKFVRNDALCRQLSRCFMHKGRLGLAKLAADRAMEIDPQSETNRNWRREVLQAMEASKLKSA